MAMLRIGAVEPADLAHIIEELPVEKDEDDLRSAEEVPEEEDIVVPSDFDSASATGIRTV